jgi:tetratricopeptide (TPR) repeat protein
VNNDDAERTANVVQLERTCLAGRWRAKGLGGSYRFSAGLHDNYLELYTASGEFANYASGGLVQLSDDLSLQGFCGGTGLAALELLTNYELHVDPADRLMMLIGQLEQHLPNLRLCGDGECEFPETQLARATFLPAERHDEPSPSEPPETLTSATWSQLAATAVAEGRFRSAERLGRQAYAEGDVEAAEFLDALSAVRRAAKAVRRHPRSGLAYLGLARAYFVAEAGPAAVQAAKRAVVLDPTLGDAHALVGFEMLHNNDREGALARLSMARSAAEVGVLTQALAHELQQTCQHADVQIDIATSAPAAQPADRGPWIRDFFAGSLGWLATSTSWANRAGQALQRLQQAITRAAMSHVDAHNE